THSGLKICKAVPRRTNALLAHAHRIVHRKDPVTDTPHERADTVKRPNMCRHRLVRESPYDLCGNSLNVVTAQRHVNFLSVVLILRADVLEVMLLVRHVETVPDESVLCENPFNPRVLPVIRV